MKIAVCDDALCDRQQIANYALQYAHESMLDFKVDTFENGENLLSAFKKSDYRIAFLDICMDGLSGVKVGYKIRETNKNCMIIFTTISPDYMADGFEIGAVHYLLKPLRYKDITAALNRCIQFMSESEKYFCVMVNRQITRIHLKNLLYVETCNETILIHTVHKIFKTYMSLAKIEELVAGTPFLKCHRCYIVNMNFIVDVLETDFLLENGEKVPIRKNGRKQVIDEYSNYFFESMRRLDNG